MTRFVHEETMLADVLSSALLAISWPIEQALDRGIARLHYGRGLLAGSSDPPLRSSSKEILENLLG